MTASPAQPVEERVDMDPRGRGVEASRHALGAERGRGSSPGRGGEKRHEDAPEAGAGEDHDGKGDYETVLERFREKRSEVIVEELVCGAMEVLLASVHFYVEDAGLLEVIFFCFSPK